MRSFIFLFVTVCVCVLGVRHVPTIMGLIGCWQVGMWSGRLQNWSERE